MSDDTYKYQVGDRGLLKNGTDTYRIVAIDVNTYDDYPILALIVDNHNDGGQPTDEYETAMSFKADGRDAYAVFSGNGKTSLTPPEVTIQPV